MSLTTSCICLSNYRGLPTDITNIISSYVGSSTKWIPQYDTRGRLYRKVNPIFYHELSNICCMKPDLEMTRATHSLVMNRTHYYDTARTYVLRTFINDNHDIQVILYTSVEVDYDIFEYITVSYVVSSSTFPVRQFLRGTLHRPYEQVSFNREQTITQFDMSDDNITYINHTDVHVEYVWNEEFEIGEYVIQQPQNQPMLHDYEHDDAHWGF